jgi:hypothetical protein
MISNGTKPTRDSYGDRTPGCRTWWSATEIGQQGAYRRPDGVDSIPVFRAQVGESGGKDAVLLFEDVLAEQAEGLDEPGGPGRVGGCAAGGFAEDRFDVPVVGLQGRDLVGEVGGKDREQPVFLDMGVVRGRW